MYIGQTPLQRTTSNILLAWHFVLDNPPIRTSTAAVRLGLLVKFVHCGIYPVRSRCVSTRAAQPIWWRCQTDPRASHRTPHHKRPFDTRSLVIARRSQYI